MRFSQTLLALLIAIQLAGQSNPRLEKHAIESAAFDTLREITVFLPEGYRDSGTTKYPVMVVFDGQFRPFFDMVTGMADYLSAIDELPTFIIVGIHTHHRPSEFTPAPLNQKTRTDWGDTKVGNASVLERHLIEEVFPLLEETYRTDALRFGIGHSLGGTFVTQSVFYNRGLFHAAISISPNMAYDFQQLPNALAQGLSTGELPQAWHFMSAGTEGNMENQFRIGAELADSIYRARPDEKLVWHYSRLEGLGHMYTPIRTLSEGFAAFGGFWFITEVKALELLSDSTKTYVEGIQNHVEAQSQWLGQPMQLSVDEINMLGYTAGYEEKWEAALPVFEWAISLYPEDPNIYDSRGEALENLGNLEEAHRSYNIALEVLEANKSALDPETYAFYAQTFSENAKRTKAKLREK